MWHAMPCQGVRASPEDSENPLTVSKEKSAAPGPLGPRRREEMVPQQGRRSDGATRKTVQLGGRVRNAKTEMITARTGEGAAGSKSIGQKWASRSGAVGEGFVDDLVSQFSRSGGEHRRKHRLRVRKCIELFYLCCGFAVVAGVV